MNRTTRAVIALLSLPLGATFAQQQPPNAVSLVTIPAKSSDVSSPDAIIAALYDANTIMVDQKRDLDRFRSLFIPGARLMPTARPGGNGFIRIQSVEDYVAQASRGQPRHGFSEREIARTSEAFGNIMQVFSTYESRRDSSDTHPGRGINSIQLFTDGKRWWVVGVLWDNERPDNPIPAVFMKSHKAAP